METEITKNTTSVEPTEKPVEPFTAYGVNQG